MSGELANIYDRVSKLEKDGAVCMDRTSRHDDEIRALSRDVQTISHEVTRVNAAVNAGFRETSAAHQTMMRTLDEVKQAQTAQAAEVKPVGEWKAVIRFSLATVGAVAALVGILKGFGVF